MLCRVFRNRSIPCNSFMSLLLTSSLIKKTVEIQFKLTLQKSTVHALLFNKTEATAGSKQRIEIKTEVSITRFTSDW